MGHWQTRKRMCEMPRKASTQYGMDCFLSLKRKSATEMIWTD